MIDESKMLFPNAVITDSISRAVSTFGYNDFSAVNFRGRPYFYLHWQWPYTQENSDLPPGYDYYIVSNHMEQIDIDWLRKQAQRVSPIIVLNDYNCYQNYEIPNVYFYRWILWHRVLEKMMKLFGTSYNKNIQYKASAFCNRITQSKLIVTTALLEYLEKQDCLISLSDWLEEKNIHGWQSTGNVLIDQLVDIFKTKYFGQLWSMDNFNNATSNNQFFTGNPAQIAYQQAALHFTNESLHYSFTQYNNQSMILPGPLLTEKTFKCWLGATAFISVGQFDVYETLKKLGMEFDYGIDLSFDQDPGNLSRLEKIVVVIKNLQELSADQIYNMTKQSSLHNQQIILNGLFFQSCQAVNNDTLEKLQKIL